ncbi:MAG: PAS domain S-box protein [Thermoplasmata archaeon]|nr:PAS domain S-box protein [Thermoplasmata archaeon]
MNGKSRENVEVEEEQGETEALKEIEKIYNLLFESTSDSIYALDREWRYILANSATEHLTGMQKEELLGKKITEIFPGIEKTKIFESFRRVMEKRKAEVVSDEYVFDDGGRRWHEVRVYPSPRGILCISRDVTEQREMEKKLREMAETSRMMLNATHDMVALADFDGTILDLNDSLAELLGRKREELLGKNFKDVLKKKVFEDAYSRALEVKRTKKPVQLEYEQNSRWFHNRLYPVFDENGEVCRIADFLQDITEQKEMEQKLREAAEKAQTLLNATHDMVILLEWDTTILDMNDAMAKSLGIDKNEAIGKKLRDYLPPEIFEIRHNYAMKVKETKKPVRFTDGRAGKYFHNIFYPIFDGNGEVFRLAVFSRDVTEQKKAEEELVENQKKLRALIDATHDLVLLADVDGTILDLNDSMAMALMGEKDEIIGTNIKEHLPPAVYESRTARVRNIQRTKKPERFVDTKRGRWFDNHFYPIFDEKGEVIQIAVFTRDITEQIEAEEALKESEERFRTVVENAGEGIGVVDENEVFVFANPAAEKIFGVGKEKLTGRNLMDFLSDEEKEKVLQQTEKRRQGKKTTYELEIIRKDGEKRIIVVTSTPRWDKDGKYEGAFAVFRDITERKMLEDELRKREEMYRKLVETLPDAVTMTDLEGNIIYASEKTLEIHGFENEGELMGKSSLDLIVPEERERAINNIKKTLERGYVKDVEYALLRKDGSTFIGSLSASVIRGADGNPEAFIGITRDITARKKAEQEIMHLNQFLESIFENANVWIDVLDENGNVVMWNKAAEKISGYSAQEVVGHGKIWEWLYPDEDYRKEITEKAAAIIKDEVVEDFETTTRCKDGEIKIISWNSRNLVDEKGRSIGSIAFGRDITARKEAEKELVKFKTIADNANYGVAIADIDGTIQYANEYYARIHGYTVEEVMGNHISIFYNEEQFKEVMKLRNTLIEKEGLSAGEIWHTHKDGHVFPMMMSGALIRDENGKPAYVAVTALDITEYKRMEEQMSQQEKLAALGKIASVVSHELNTPLANISITAEYLKSLLPEKHKKELDVILHEVRNASGIIKKTLGFSRMGSMEFRKANIEGVVKKAVEAVKARRNMDGVTIKTNLSPCDVICDEYRLFEAMTNIIDNAVLARNSESKKHIVDIASTLSDNNVVITVKDNGVGMNTATLKKSDKPFFTTRAKGEGTGLGLFISKWVIKEHGGSLVIESKENVGTEVTVTIPCGGDSYAHIDS